MSSYKIPTIVKEALEMSRYDFIGIQQYRKRHPEEPEGSSGEWIRYEDLCNILGFEYVKDEPEPEYD